MNRLSREQRAHILNLLCEGSSMRAASRIADVSINTVTKLLIDAGKACAEYQDKALRSLRSQRIQVDEIWAFIGAKEKNIPQAQKGFGRGDVWTWTAIDADSKLIVSWLVSDRTAEAAREFMDDVASRLVRRVQLTSDGLSSYPPVIQSAFKGMVDYAQLVKFFSPEGTTSGTGRYSPPRCIGARADVISGKPDPDHIATSYVERQNLTMPMSIRRFTRLTNAFSKKFENHAHGVALHFMFYNFCRIHKTPRVTPAMEAGLTDHVWNIAEIVQLIA